MRFQDTIQFLNTQTLCWCFSTASGTHVEVHYRLMARGIPSTAIPIDPSGQVRTELYLDHWVSTQRALEAADKTIDIGDMSEDPFQPLELVDYPDDIDIELIVPLDFDDTSENKCDKQVDEHKVLIPGRFDVIFGRGKKYQNHTGNVRFRHIVDMHGEEYEGSCKYQKANIVEKVKRIIKESPGLFLRQSPDSGIWEEVDCPDEVEKKISHAFRARRTALKKQQMIEAR